MEDKKCLLLLSRAMGISIPTNSFDALLEYVNTNFARLTPYGEIIVRNWAYTWVFARINTIPHRSLVDRYYKNLTRTAFLAQSASKVTPEMRQDGIMDAENNYTAASFLYAIIGGILSHHERFYNFDGCCQLIETLFREELDQLEKLLLFDQVVELSEGALPRYVPERAGGNSETTVKVYLKTEEIGRGKGSSELAAAIAAMQNAKQQWQTSRELDIIS